MDDEEKFEMMLNDLQDAISSGRLGRERNRSMWDSDQNEFLRDFRELLGYPDHIHFDQYHSFYQRDPIAGRLIDKPVEDSWKEPPEVKQVNENGEAVEDSRFNEQVSELFDEHQMVELFKRADKLQRIGQYGIMFLGLSDVSNRQGQKGRPPTVEGPGDSQLDTLGDLLYIQPFHQGEVEIEGRVTDSTDPDFGMPEEYEIEVMPEAPSENDEADGTDSIFAHRLRVIHLNGQPEASAVRGRPALQRVFNRLIDMEKVLGPSAESLYQLIAPRYWAKAKDDFEFPDADGSSDFTQKWEQFVNNIRDRLETSGVEDIKTLGGQDVDPTPVFEVLAKAIATAEDMPMRILFGSETGERASREDRRAWFGERMSDRQRNHNESNILRPMIDRLQRLGILDDVPYTVEWPSLFEMTEQEKAEAAKTRASAVKQIAPQQATEAVAPMPLLRDKVLRFLPQELPDVNRNMKPVDNGELKEIDSVYQSMTKA